MCRAAWEQCRQDRAWEPWALACAARRRGRAGRVRGRAPRRLLAALLPARWRGAAAAARRHSGRDGESVGPGRQWPRGLAGPNLGARHGPELPRALPPGARSRPGGGPSGPDTGRDLRPSSAGTRSIPTLFVALEEYGHYRCAPPESIDAATDCVPVLMGLAAGLRRGGATARRASSRGFGRCVSIPSCAST